MRQNAADYEQYFDLLLNSVPALIAYVDPHQRYRFVNHAYAEFFQSPPDAFPGRTLAEMLGPGPYAQISAKIALALGGEGQTYDRQTLWHGEMRDLRASYVPHLDVAGAVQGLLVLIRDITTQATSERALRASEEQFRKLLANTPDIISRFDRQFRFLYVSSAAQPLFGHPPEFHIGKRHAEVGVPPELSAGLEAALEEIFQTGERRNANFSMQRRDGAVRRYEGLGIPEFGPDGQVRTVLTIVRDTTHEFEAAERLRESETRYRSLVTATSSIVWTAAPDGAMTGDTAPWVAYTGREVPAGPQPWSAFLHPDDIAAAAHAWSTASGTRGVLEHTARIWNHQAGQYRWCVTRAVPLRNHDGSIREWVGATTDVNDRREAEARYGALFNSSRDGILIVNDEGEYVDVNPSYCALLKSTREDLLGHVYVPFIPPDRVEDARQAFIALKRDGRYRGEFPMQATDGTLVEIEWTSFANFLPGLHCCMARDITARRHFEQQLQQTQKLESLGVLAGGIAHDFNNLLVGMMGNASLAMDALPPNASAAPMLQDVMKASERAAQLTRQLLAYAGKARLSTEPVNLSNLVEELTGLLGASIPRTVHLRLDLAPTPLVVDADPTQLQQIIMNLVINAAESFPAAAPGVVTVSTAVSAIGDGDRQHAIVPLPEGAGEYVVLTVADTGSGMTREVRDCIFDPFFTTKFQGRGLGLSAVLGIIKSHRGGMTLRTALGQGTTFEVLLPRSRAGAALGTLAVAATPASVTGTILVVDDEDMVRAFLRRLLVRAGYEVIDAVNGQEAINVFRSGVALRAVILDLAMPVLTGDQAAPELRRLRPEVPIVLSSGYPETEAITRFADTGVKAFLQKPYTSKALLQKLTETLATG